MVQRQADVDQEYVDVEGERIKAECAAAWEEHRQEQMEDQTCCRCGDFNCDCYNDEEEEPREVWLGDGPCGTVIWE